MATPALPYAHLGEALATDYFQVRDQFTDEQWEHFIATRRFVDREVLPVINEYWEAAELPVAADAPARRSWGCYGEDIEGYGCPGMSPLARGLVNMELHRGDGSLGTFLGVQSGLAMKSIAMLGSDEQKERWLPAMARLDAVGRLRADRARARLGLRGAGDHRAARRRRLGARRRQALDRQRLDRRRGRRVGALGRGRPGQGLPRREGHARASRRRRWTGKGASRAIWQADIRLDGVARARGARLPGAERFKDAGRVLVTTRTTCAWGALGTRSPPTTPR